jgi:hypothetical protein
MVHDNNIASQILQPKVIKQRNKTNAITMSGQVAAWFMEVWCQYYKTLFNPLFSEV